MNKLLSFLSYRIRDVKVIGILLPYCWSSVLSIFLIWYLLWRNNQGQDILIELSSGHLLNNPSYILFLIAITTLSFFNWFLPKLSFSRKFDKKLIIKTLGLAKNEEKSLDRIKKFLPRYLGYLTIIIAGYSITHTGELQWFYGNKDGHISVIASVISLLIPIIFFTKLPHLFESIIRRPVRIVLLVVAFLLFFSLVPLSINYFPHQNGNIYFSFLLLSPFMFGLLLYGLFVVRTRLIADNLQPDGLLYRFVNFIKDDSPDSPFINWTSNTAIVFVLAHLFLNIYPELSIYLGPGPVFVISLLALVIIVNVIVLQLMKNRNQNKSVYILFGIISLLCFIFSNNNKKFQVHSLEGKIAERQSISSYLDNWVDARATSPDSTIYLIASYGGGIRATYWTNLVLSRFMDATDGRFLHQTFGLSGSSGGMIGQGIFLSLGDQKNEQYEKDPYFNEVVSLFRKKDYLSPMISRLLGFDLLKSVFPIPGPDRHRSLETLFEDRLDLIGKGDIFKADFLDYWYKDTLIGRQNSLPILICNSTYSQKGIRATYSPVVLSGANSAHSLDLFEELGNIDSIGFGSIPFSTAVLQAARFPYASPPGTYPNGMQFVDAGYYDNLGGSGIIDLLQVLARYLDCSTYRNRFKIKVIIINSSPISEDVTHQKNVSAYPGISNPLKSYMNTGTGHSNAIEDALRDYCSYLKTDKGLDIAVISNHLRPNTNYTEVINGRTVDLQYIFPLGWYLSTKSLNGMRDKAFKLDIWKEDTLQQDIFEMDISNLIKNYEIENCVDTKISKCARNQKILNLNLQDCSDIEILSNYSDFTERVVSDFVSLSKRKEPAQNIQEKRNRIRTKISRMSITQSHKRELEKYTDLTAYITALQLKANRIEIKINDHNKINPSIYNQVSPMIVYRPKNGQDTNLSKERKTNMTDRNVEKGAIKKSNPYKKLERLNANKIRMRSTKRSKEN